MQENPTFQSENPVQRTQNTGKKESAPAFLLSLIAFGLVVAVGVIFLVLGQIKQASISSTQEETAALQSQIKNLEQDKRNAIASLVESQTIPSIHLENLIFQFRQAAQRSQVQFQGFSVQNDTITTNLIATDTARDAVEKVIAMMKDFAKEGQQGNFSLEPIFSLSGDRTTRTTPITFKIVPLKANNENASATASGALTQ